MKTKHLLAFL
jgi:hypothetical protein